MAIVKTNNSAMRLVCVLALGLLAMCPLFADSSAARADTISGLVGHWAFDNNVVPQPDSSGQGNHGTVVAATWVKDAERGGAMSFDGDNDYVEAPDSPSLSITGDMTIAAWVNVTNYNNYRGIVGKTGAPPNAQRPGPYDFYFAQEFGGQPNFWRGNGVGGPSSQGQYLGAVAPLTNEWEHVVATMQGTTVQHYLNGAANGSTGSISVSMVDADQPLRIGNRNDLFVDMLGRMDDVRIYNRALSADDVVELYNATVPEPSALLLLAFGTILLRRKSK
jgi:hypothetical protein